jgi:hypothetical protein
MPPFLYRCPNTGYRIQGFVAEEVSDDQTYVSVTCIMCRQLNLVNPSIGKVVGEDDNQQPRQLGDVGGDAPCLVAGEEVGCRPPAGRRCSGSGAIPALRPRSTWRSWRTRTARLRCSLSPVRLAHFLPSARCIRPPFD